MNSGDDATAGDDYLGFLASVAKRGGDIGTYRRRGECVALLNSPEIVREVLVKMGDAFTKGPLQSTAFQALLGGSLSLAEGARHKMLLRLLAKAFAPQRVVRLVGRIGLDAESFCSTWADGCRVHLFAELYRLTTRTVVRSLVDEPALYDEFGTFSAARERLWRWMNATAEQRHSLTQPVANGDECSDAAVVRDTLTEIVRIRSRDRACDHQDVLADILAENATWSEPLGTADVSDQILALIFAAHETSAVAIYWAVYLLASDSVVRGRIQREVGGVLAGRLPGPSDLAALPFTLQVVREAMRLYPPAARQFRIATRELSLGGRGLMAGTPVTVCQYTMHRMAAAFPDPQRFDPDRFGPDSAPRHPQAYLPFGAGEHICLGRHYALMEVHALLAFFVDRYEFVFSEPVKPRLAVALRPECDREVVVHRRST